jgi:hypothetical protein
MGRRKKGKSVLTRVRLVDLQKLKAIARSCNLSLPDYLSMIAKKNQRLR